MSHPGHSNYYAPLKPIFWASFSVQDYVYYNELTHSGNGNYLLECYENWLMNRIIKAKSGIMSMVIPTMTARVAARSSYRSPAGPG